MSANCLKANISVEHFVDYDTLWVISRRELALPIHKMNTTQIATALRCRGFTLTPDRDRVIRIPSEVQATRMQVSSTLRKALLVSFIPQMVCDDVLRSTRVVRLAARTIEGPATNSSHRHPPRHIPDFEKNQLFHLRPDLPHS